MKISLFDAYILLFYLIQPSSSADDSNLLHARERSSKISNPSSGAVRKKPRFISFNTNDGKIEVNWEVSVPFISIPLDDKGNMGNGDIEPLINVNAKALTIAGIATAIIAFIIPLLVNPTPEMHYRSNRNLDWLDPGYLFNDITFGDTYLTPCVQRIICTTVSVASHSENPTKTDQIIDGFSSDKWFNELINGTTIHEAIITGKEENRDCSNVYKACPIPSKLLKNLIKQLGVV